MYLNEKSWEILQDEPYIVDSAIREFLDIYAAVKRKYPRKEIYVPEDELIYLRSTKYPLEKWMASADQEYKRLFLTFRGKCIRYSPEDEYEVTYKGETLKGGTEAYLNESFMMSICLDSKWEQKVIDGELCSINDSEEEIVHIQNVFDIGQLEESSIKDILAKESSINLYNYDELWRRRAELFPHLCFCPSVEQNLRELEVFYLNQVLRKLEELETYCVKYGRGRFDATLLSKTTLESKSTMNKYETQHTFVDEDKVKHIASWHMRFTGIPGRIYFVPEYKENCILICYVGKKLPNVTYPT